MENRTKIYRTNHFFFLLCYPQRCLVIPDGLVHPAEKQLPEHYYRSKSNLILYILNEDSTQSFESF